MVDIELYAIVLVFHRLIRPIESEVDGARGVHPKHTLQRESRCFQVRYAYVLIFSALYSYVIVFDSHLLINCLSTHHTGMMDACSYGLCFNEALSNQIPFEHLNPGMRLTNATETSVLQILSVSVCFLGHSSLHSRISWFLLVINDSFHFHSLIN